MGIELLGPLHVDGGHVALQRRDQVVLSALAVRSGEVMAPDELAEAVWGDEPPPSWPKVVQGCVVRLRRSLGQPLIETTDGGYRLTVGGDELDTCRFEQGVDRGRQLAIAGEPERAAIAFERALDLWRGTPFEVLDGWSPGTIERARLEELRRTAEERLLDARLQAGEHRDVVAIAEARVSEEPLREHRWAILALALYRCGRQADALRSLRHARHTLVEQLGIEPGAELVKLEAAILRQDESLAAEPEPPAVAEQCPYKGLASYDVDDAEAFFGRDGEVAACLERLRSTPLLVVTGPSGCGKSSLVRAGLVPALARAGRTVAVCVPGPEPDAAMTTAVSSVEGTPVLVVDQFEELFTLDDDGTQARSFCARLAEYASGQAPVVVAVRADHVASLAVAPEFARLAEHGLHLVSPLAGDSLRAAIEGPAALAGLRLEPGLVDLLVRDCEGEPGALPLLSHALAETWRRRDGRVLTVEGYRATGEIRGAVARSADRLYESLPPEQRPKLRSMLLRLVSPSPDGEPVRSRVSTRSLGGDADRDRVLGLLVRARLVTAEEDSVELAHEALARAWPRLRSWLDEDAAGQRILRHLATAADGWESLGRPSTELYRGARLEAVLEWRASASPDLTETEAAFLDASVAEATSERQELVERARAQARQNRRLRGALLGVAVLLAVALAGGVLAFQQRQTARSEGRRAALTALTSSAAALRTNRRGLAALLAIEAHRLAPGADTESALFGTFTAWPGAMRSAAAGLGADRYATDARFVGATDTVAVLDERGAVSLVDLETGARQQFDAIADEEGAGYLAIDPGGRHLASLWRPGTPPDEGPGYSLLTVWDVQAVERRFDPVRIPFVAGSMAVSPDGELVAVGGGEDGLVQVLDAATGEVVHEIESLGRPADAFHHTLTAGVVFSPSGTLAVGSQAGPIRLVNPRNGAELRRLDGPQETSNQYVFFNRDGTEIVSVGWLGAMGFDVESGEPLWPDPHPVPYCSTWGYAERIGNLLCGDEFGTVTAFDVATGLELGQRFDSQLGAVCALAISADGTRLAELSSCEAAAHVVEWRLDGSGPATALVVDSAAEHHVGRFGFAGDADALVTELGEGDDAVVTHVIDVSTGETIARLSGVRRLLPTDDPGRAVAYFPADATIGWYDVDRRTRIGDGVALGGDLLPEIARGGDRIVVVTSAEAQFGLDTVLHGVDLEAGRLIAPAIDGSGRFEISEVVVGPDAIYAAVLSLNGDRSDEVQRRDPVRGTVLASAAGYTNVAAGGGVLVGSTFDGRVEQLDPVSLDPIGLPFPGVNGRTTALDLDEAGQRLMVLGGDEKLRFYDVASRTQLGDAIDIAVDMSRGDPDAVLRDDGMRAAADTGRGIVVWDLDPAHWVEAACRLAGRNLTHAEWDQYIGDLAPYRRTCEAYPEA